MARRLARRPAGDVALGDLRDGAARGADDVVVVATAAQAIDDLAARAGDGVDGAVLDQQGHRALGGALAEAGRAATAAREQHRQRQPRVRVTERVEDRLALRRPAQAARAEAAPDGLGDRYRHRIR
nr:hypothetical protein [Miltoncostaea marina]